MAMRINLATWLWRLLSRIVLTARYRMALGYSWHLAWVKAERS